MIFSFTMILGVPIAALGLSLRNVRLGRTDLPGRRRGIDSVPRA